MGPAAGRGGAFVVLGWFQGVVERCPARGGTSPCRAVDAGHAWINEHGSGSMVACSERVNSAPARCAWVVVAGRSGSARMRAGCVRRGRGDYPMN